MAKKKTSEQLQAEIEAFLAKGGAIQQVPYAGDVFPVEDLESELQDEDQSPFLDVFRKRNHDE